MRDCAWQEQIRGLWRIVKGQRQELQGQEQFTKLLEFNQDVALDASLHCWTWKNLGRAAIMSSCNAPPARAAMVVPESGGGKRTSATLHSVPWLSIIPPSMGLLGCWKCCAESLGETCGRSAFTAPIIHGGHAETYPGGNTVNFKRSKGTVMLAQVQGSSTQSTKAHTVIASFMVVHAMPVLCISLCVPSAA